MVGENSESFVTHSLTIVCSLLAGVIGGMIGSGSMMIVFFPELKYPDSLKDEEHNESLCCRNE